MFNIEIQYQVRYGGLQDQTKHQNLFFLYFVLYLILFYGVVLYAFADA